jgi:hypothetical protein
MNMMKEITRHLTNEGKRNLLRDLCDQLSYAEIDTLVSKYSDRLRFAQDGEPYITINASENELNTTYQFWLEREYIETDIIDTESYDEEY